MRCLKLIFRNCAFIWMVTACANDDIRTITEITCEFDINTFEIQFEVPITYSKASSIVRGVDNKLSAFTLQDNKHYKLIGPDSESVLATNFERGDFFAVYNNDEILTFKSPKIKIYNKDSLIREFAISDTFSFFGNTQARPIVTEDLIIAAVYPNSGITSSYVEYMHLLNNGPLFVVINRSTGASKLLGEYPTHIFPYNQNNERMYNGLEYTYHFCLLEDDIYFMFRTSKILYKVNVNSGKQAMVRKLDHDLFRDVGRNPADEAWEKQQKGLYLASNTHVGRILPVNKDSKLAIIVTKAQKLNGNYLDPLANSGFLVIYDIKTDIISNIVCLEDHYPFIEYADDAILLIRQKKLSNNVQNNKITSFTVIHHVCLLK